jgi:RNA-directed DNA polymerase
VKARTQKRNAGHHICKSTAILDGSVDLARNGGSLVSEEGKLLERMLSRYNMQEAWRRVKANRGAAGVDGLSIEESTEMIRFQWPSIRATIENGTYVPSPVRRTEIPKGKGETRPLGIPTVLDRLVQQALAQVLVPIFDPNFSNQSFGFRPNRSAHQAVQFISTGIKSGKRWAIDIDLSKFFDRVVHDLLMERVSRRVNDKRVLKLIGKFLRAGVSIDGVIHPTNIGVPQGGPLSPLLANIMLDDLDKEMENRGHTFARYADDFVVLIGSRNAGMRVMKSLRRYVEIKLKLKVNEQKSKVIPSGESEFLGFTFARKKIRWTEKSYSKFKARIIEITNRSWGVSLKRRIITLNRYLKGWAGYFCISEYYSPIPSIDPWIQRRIRMCILKQWRKPRTKIRKLIKLGAPEKEAVQTGMSRKGYWRLSKTFALNAAMDNKWFGELKLVSIREEWINFHYPKG